MPKPAKKRSKVDVKDAERDNTDDSYSDSTSDSGPDDRSVGCCAACAALFIHSVARF